ncbi:MAG: RES domain-containing protein [Gammaproteobacteria bacterium]|nr:RES domain-containing protein [Gammaproteobacteria bacterium]
MTSAGRAKLPRAPDRRRLQRLAPAVVPIRAGTLVHRVYRRGGVYRSSWSTLRDFGPTDARFDHHLVDETGVPQRQDRAIGYYAGDIPTALAETFQSGRLVDRQRDQPWLASFHLTRDLRVLDLTGTFAVQAGGSMKLVSGPRSWSQNWSRAFYECYPEVEGLYYPSSLTNLPAMAIYERVLRSSPFPAAPVLHRALADPLLIDALREASAMIGYDLM